jgi:phage shock protein PspC (stress-responsive transcriptional regulator)
MKKNISINIAGTLFHIEETGYHLLEEYLKSINAYFSTFDDHKDIIEDIESRISEIFLDKRSTGSEVILLSDVESLITTMGTVTDFEASLDTDNNPSSDDPPVKEEGIPKDEDYTSGEKRKLRRNTKNQLIGGVASGFAYYFKIDPLWVRLLILGLFFNALFIGLSTITLITYLLLWIALPGASLIEEPQVRKLYRNKEGRVIAGVASGISAYFGIDKVIIRLLLLVSIFLGGFGIIFYFVLWIITPEAVSITEKMKMEGEPITLSNIETNFKNRLKVAGGDENPFIKIIMIPFKLLAVVLETLAKILGPLLAFLGEVLRIALGIGFIVTGLGLSFLLLLIFLIALGINLSWTDIMISGFFPLELLVSSINTLTAVTLLLIFMVPMLAIVLLGLTIITKRTLLNRYLGATLFTLWILAIAGLSFLTPATIKDFISENYVQLTQNFEPTDSLSTLTLAQRGQVNDRVKLYLTGHDKSDFKAITRVISRGNTLENAENNAAAVSYAIVQEENEIIFARDINLNMTPFRFQEAEITLYIPFGLPFKIDADLGKLLRNTLYPNGYNTSYLKGNKWVFDQNGLNCITCDLKTPDTPTPPNMDEVTPQRPVVLSAPSWEEIDLKPVIYDFKDFEEITISSQLYVIIEQADQYFVALKKGPDAESLQFKMVANELTVKTEADRDWWDEDPVIETTNYLLIRTPHVESITLNGAIVGEIDGFKSKELELTLTGATSITADVEVKFLEAYLKGASTLQLTGEAQEFKTKLIGACNLDASRFNTKTTFANVTGASTAHIYGDQFLDIDVAGVSTVIYGGTDNTEIQSGRLSNVIKK